MTAKKASGYTWNGVWDAGAGGWQEFFGNAEDAGLPTRDLTAEDVGILRRAVGVPDLASGEATL